MPDAPAPREELHRRVAQLETQNRDLHHAIEKFETIFRNVPASVYVFDAQGLITAVNEYHIEHPGRGLTRPGDYIGRCAFERPSIVASGLSEAFRGLLEGHDFEAHEVCFPYTSGGEGEMFFSMRGVPLYEAERIIGAAVLSEDVTELVQLRRSFDRVRRLPHLEGLLPICARCKKIRDEAGRWHPVEVYIRDHSKADFSHGLCPTCVVAVWRDDDGNRWEV